LQKPAQVALQPDHEGDSAINKKPIRSDEELATALARLTQLWGAESDCSEGSELELLAKLIVEYERQHHPLPPSDPIEALKFLIDQQLISVDSDR
jgi:HTH-type transcriptional regulator/antitoxin HigA